MELNELYQQIQEGLYQTEARETGEGSVWTTYILDNYVIQSPKPGEESRIPKNTQIYLKLRENDVPTAKPRLSQEESPAFAIYDRIDGESLSMVEMLRGREARLEAVKNTGEALAQTHQIKTKDYGIPIPQTNYQEGCFQNWPEFLKTKADQVHEYLEDTPFQKLAVQIDDQINYDEVPNRPESRLLHNDLHSENVMVEPDLEAYLIDFDNAIVGDPRFDLIKSTQFLFPDEEAQEQLIQGYTHNRSFEITDQLKEQYELIATLQNLEGAEATRRNEEINVERWLEGFYDQLGW